MKIQLNIPEEKYNELKELAAKDERSLTNFLNRIINKITEEDIYNILVNYYNRKAEGKINENANRH